MEKIENARITKVSITMEEHGCLTFWIYLEACRVAAGIITFKRHSHFIFTRFLSPRSIGDGIICRRKRCFAVHDSH